MNTEMIEVKARCENGKVYFEDMPDLNMQSFDFVAKVPSEHTAQNHKISAPALELMARIQNILGEHNQSQPATTTEQDRKTLLEALEEKYL